MWRPNKLINNSHPKYLCVVVDASNKEKILLTRALLHTNEMSDPDKITQKARTK